MNCDRIQNQLLAALHPDRPPPEVLTHLAECPACRAWQERLVGIEREIPLIAVPRSREGKRELFRKLHAGSASEWEAPREDRATCPRTETTEEAHTPTISLYHTLTLVAAGLLLMVSGWWLFRGSPTPVVARNTRPVHAREPLLAQLLEYNVRLSQATTHGERAQELGRLVEHLHDRTQDLRPLANTRTLENLARLYDKAIHDVVMPGAKRVPSEQRRAILVPLAEQLTRVGDQTEQWIETAGPGSAEPLRQIVLVARLGNRQLRDLLPEGTP